MSEQHSGKHLPSPTPETRAFWEGCKRGELLLQHCQACGKHQFYPRILCSHCMSDNLDWVSVSGRGQIRSYTIATHPVSKAYAAETPYVIALIELSEGPTMMSNIIDCDLDELKVGAQVEVTFEAWTEEISIPKFRLVQ